jgi:hypothetical protein
MSAELAPAASGGGHLMDIEKLIRRLRNDADAYRNGKTLGRAFADQEDVLDNAATAISTLQAENEKLRAELDDLRIQWDMYGGDVGITAVYEELEQVKQERDAAVGDMEALMWYSGEGCQICANAVEVHKRPYVRLDCKLGSGIDCKPKWRGQKED